jgi:hypothetical protein
VNNNSKTNKRIRRKVVIARMQKYIATRQLVNGARLTEAQIEHYKREADRLEKLN